MRSLTHLLCGGKGIISALYEWRLQQKMREMPRQRTGFSKLPYPIESQ
jgi:hypothetical protein